MGSCAASDGRLLQTKIADLERAAMKIGEAVNKSSGGASGGAAGGEAGGAAGGASDGGKEGGGTTVDAEFKEKK